jgi:hypothetical protein
MTELPLPAGVDFALPTGINDAGQITGTITGNIDGIANSSRAVIWANKTTAPVLLPLPPDYYLSGAWDINEAGDVSGGAYFNGLSHPIVWMHDGRIIDLGVLGPVNSATAFGLNDAGQAVGQDEEFGDESSTIRALIWALPSTSPGTTSPGNEVEVIPVDPTTNTTPVTLTFDQVTGAGATTVTSSSQGAPPPSGFRLGNPPRYYEIATTATFSGPINVCISYEPSQFNRPARLRLFHDGGDGWQDVTTQNDPTAGRICGTVSSLSPFALFESLYTLSGFRAPVDNTPVVNTVKAGQAVPVKFALGGNWGLNIFVAGHPSVTTASCDAFAPSDMIEQTVAAGSSQLQYDAATNSYTYIWKTEKGWGSTCRLLTLRFIDGQELTAKFKLSR